MHKIEKTANTLILKKGFYKDWRAGNADKYELQASA